MIDIDEYIYKTKKKIKKKEKEIYWGKSSNPAYALGDREIAKKEKKLAELNDIYTLLNELKSYTNKDNPYKSIEYNAGRKDGEDFGYNEALNDLEDWMVKRFGGGDPASDRSIIFRHLLDMKKPIEVGE